MAALRIEQVADILRVTMARPDLHNAFDAELIVELTGAFADVGDARAVVLAGDGPSFCAGADVDWMRASIELSYEENVADARRLRMMLETINCCPAPVIAASRATRSAAVAGWSPARTSRSPRPRRSSRSPRSSSGSSRR